MSAPIPYIGNYGFIGMAKEAVFGTPVAATTYWPITSEGFETDPGYQPVPTIRGTRAENNLSFGGEIKSVGNLVLPFGSTNGALLLAGALGQDTVVGAASPYTHTMIPKESGIPSFTVEKNLGGLTSQQFAGCLVNKLDVEMTTGAVAQLTADFVNQIDITPFTPSVPSYVVDQPFSLANYAVSIFGLASPTVMSVKLGIDNQVKSTYTFTGVRYSTLNYSSGRVITGEVQVILQSMGTQYTDAMNGTYGALVLTLSQDAGHSLLVTMPKIQWGKPSQPLKRGELITQTLPFTAYFLPGTPYDLQAVIKNAVALAYV